MVTMRDVAQRANVSVTTVSFMVNGTKTLAPATRERIERAMEELGYRRNVFARALASKRTHILALVVPAVDHRLGSTAMSVVTSAAATASTLGYNLVMWPVSNDSTQLEDYIAGGLVDGVLLMEVQLEDPRVKRLEDLGLPFFLIGRTADPAQLAYADMDFEGAVNGAVDHLLEGGHRNIALVLGRLENNNLPGYGPISRTDRAFRERMAAEGLHGTVLDCEQTATAGRSAASELIAAHPETTGLVLMNEEASFGVVNGLLDAGRRVPQDVSVLSVATAAKTAGITDPPLSTMVAPGAELGRLSVEGLIQQITTEARERTQALIPCVWSDVGSTGPAPAPENNHREGITL